MSNANIGAFPSLDGDAWGKPYMSGGLTKRELFAAMAMQGMIAAGYDKDMRGYAGWREELGKEAFRFADALIVAEGERPDGPLPSEEK